MEPDSPPCLDSALMVSQEEKGFFFSRQGQVPLLAPVVSWGHSRWGLAGAVFSPHSLKERWFRRGLVFPTALSTEEAGGCTHWRSHRCSSFQRGAEGAGILVGNTQWVTRGACQPLRGSEGNQSSVNREDSGDHLAPKKHLQRNLEHSRKI